MLTIISLLILLDFLLSYLLDCLFETLWTSKAILSCLTTSLCSFPRLAWGHRGKIRGTVVKSEDKMKICGPAWAKIWIWHSVRRLLPNLWFGEFNNTWGIIESWSHVVICCSVIRYLLFLNWPRADFQLVSICVRRQCLPRQPTFLCFKALSIA